MSMGGGQSTTTTVQELSPEQRALIEPVIPIAQKYLKNPPKMFPGTGITPFNPMQKQAQQMTLDAAGRMTPSLNRIPGQFNKLMTDIPGQQQAAQRRIQPGMDFLTSGRVLNPNSNPHLRGAIDAATRPAIQSFREQVLPGITQESLGAGGYGGTRQGIAEGIASKGLQQTVADTGASMSNTNYQAGLQAMLGGLNAASDQQKNTLAAQQMSSQLMGNAGNIMSQTLLPAQLTESVGKQQQTLNQAQLSEKVQKYVSEQMIPFAVAQDVASMAFGMPGGSTKSTSDQPGNPMMGMQMAGGLMSALPALLMKGSDRRLKYAIRAICKLADGLTVYAFKYVGDICEKIGLMADEVIRVYPEAVSVRADGYAQVNYLAVPSWVGVAGSNQHAW